jgi:hypothetical protein
LLKPAIQKLPTAGQYITIFILLLVTYAYFFPRWAEWNQNSRFDLVCALVTQGTTSIDSFVANTGDYALYNGHHYSDKAPGLALAATPIFAAFRIAVPDMLIQQLALKADQSQSLGTTLKESGGGLTADRIVFFLGLTLVTLVTTAVPSALLGVILFWVLLELGTKPGIALFGTFLYALATSAFPYSNAFVGHQLTACLLFFGFALILAINKGSLGNGWLLAAGFLLGYAVITEYQTILIAAIVVIYALLTIANKPQAVGFLLIGGLPTLAILAVYDLATFGTFLPVGYMHSELWEDVHNVGFLSLTYPHLDALWGITFGVHRGLFFLSPFLLFSIVGYVWIWQRPWRRIERWVLLLTPLAFLLFNASSAMWQGGFAVGPRYLVPCLPFLAVAATLGIERAWQWKWLRPVILIVAAWSVFAVWAETIAGQSFPDYTPNPLFDLSLPQLAAGNVARNVGMVIGLSGLSSIVPLAALLVLGILFISRGWWLSRSQYRFIRERKGI